MICVFLVRSKVIAKKAVTAFTAVTQTMKPPRESLSPDVNCKLFHIFTIFADLKKITFYR